MQEKRKMKPVTMRIAELRKNLDRVVAESELPPFGGNFAGRIFIRREHGSEGEIRSRSGRMGSR